MSNEINVNIDPAFKLIPKNSVTFHIWRIEKLQVVPVPRDHYGKFFNGDSYIVFSASEKGKPAGITVKPRSCDNPDLHVHFWLGSETSADEAGAAAYKTVELDDYLGGTPVQHRETEGAESSRFMSYFNDGIRILQGGIETGFSHVDEITEPTLFHVKGRRRPIIKQLSSVSWEHFNDGDVFILQLPQAVFLWSGVKANRAEKLQAAKTTQKLKAELGGAPVIFVESGKENEMTPAEIKLWNAHLDLKKRKVAPAIEGSDEVIETKVAHEIRLYLCSDEDGTLRVTEVKGGPLLQADLHSEDSYIVDNGEDGIWVWIGKKASAKERVEAMRNAQGFVKKKGYAAHTRVSRVIDGGEPIEFKALFRTWKEKEEQVGLGKRHSMNRVAKTVQTKLDAASLHEQPHIAAQTQLVDDGSGEHKVWRVQDFEIIPEPDRNHAAFYDGNAYVISYEYHAGGKTNIIIYFWLGSKSSPQEQGTAALKTVELDDAVDGMAVQVRVVQGKEPPHLIAIFKGKFVTFSGEYKKEANPETGLPKLPLLLQIRGTASHETKATQVACRAASLNSNDVFVLLTHGHTYVWCGQGATGDEREMAKFVAQRGVAEITNIYEGQEKDDFWRAIGGKEIYASEKSLAVPNDKRSPRLFQCSNASGSFRVEEIVNFDQSDLVEDDVMILDAWDAVFLWIGEQSNKEERKQGEALIKKYLHYDPAGRDSSTPIFSIKQGGEPPNFTGFFGVWDRTIWQNKKTFDDIRDEIHSDGVQLILDNYTNSNDSNHDADYAKYPLVALQVDTDILPEGVDPAQKELHLLEEEFVKLFKMKSSEFHSLPLWKRQDMKKKAGLF